MSGSISVLSGAVEAVSAIGALAFGASGGVVLGDFSFSGFEVPEYIQFGGQMALTVHKLPGGERVIDMLGDDPSDISWSGMFIDGNPYSRAQELESLRAAGDPLPLQWGPFFYTVVIRSFSARTLYSRASYDIACTILRNEATASQGADPDLTNSVGGDILSAVASAPAVLAPILSTAQTAVSVLGRLIPGSVALSQASAAIGVAGGAVSALGTASGSALGVISNGASLSSMTASAGLVAQSLQSAAYLGRAVRNLT